MGIDRKNYENIEMPAELSSVLEKAVLRKRKSTVRKLAGTAMAFAHIFSRRIPVRPLPVPQPVYSG